MIHKTHLILIASQYGNTSLEGQMQSTFYFTNLPKQVANHRLNEPFGPHTVDVNVCFSQYEKKRIETLDHWATFEAF